MSDLSALQSSDSTKVAGAASDGTETNFVDVSSNQEIYANDTARISGFDGTVALTTTAVEAKVGTTRLALRKYLTMQGVSQNTRWGFTTNCPFTIYPNQTIIIPMQIAIYVKVTTGSGSIIIGECA